MGNGFSVICEMLFCYFKHFQIWGLLGGQQHHSTRCAARISSMGASLCKFGVAPGALSCPDTRSRRGTMSARNAPRDCHRHGRQPRSHTGLHQDNLSSNTLGSTFYHPNKENYQINSEKNFFGTVTGYQSPNNSRRPFCRYRQFVFTDPNSR